MDVTVQRLAGIGVDQHHATSAALQNVVTLGHAGIGAAVTDHDLAGESAGGELIEAQSVAEVAGVDHGEHTGAQREALALQVWGRCSVAASHVDDGVDAGAVVSAGANGHHPGRVAGGTDGGGAGAVVASRGHGHDASVLGGQKGQCVSVGPGVAGAAADGVVDHVYAISRGLVDGTDQCCTGAAAGVEARLVANDVCVGRYA